MATQSSELGIHRKIYDGSKPLADPRHEETAQYFATPKEIRNVRSVTELAQRIGVTRKTVYEWMKDPEVLLRSEWLSADTKALGRLAAKREWEEIVEAQIKLAKAGNARAARFVHDVAYPEDRPFGSYRRDRKYRPGDGHRNGESLNLGTMGE